MSEEADVIEKDAFLAEDIMAIRERDAVRIRKELSRETEAEKAKRLWIESNLNRSLG